MARYLVTGGAGFIGSHIAESLLREGHHVRVLDNLATGRKGNLDALSAVGAGSRFEWIEGDVRSIETCRRACDGVDFVIHQAALPSVQRSILDPIETNEVNVGGFVALLKAAHETGVRRVVAASSSSIYGDTPTLPKSEDMPPAPLSPYATSKVAAESYARVFAKTFGLPTVSLRYFNVFGPRQDPTSAYAAVIPAFIDAVMSGRNPTIYGTGEQSRDFTYVDNVVRANLDACTRGDGGGEAINIAGGSRCTLLELLAAIGRATDTRPTPQFLPRRPGDVMHSLAAIEAARRLIGYEPTVGLEEGLGRTVEHFKRESVLRRTG